MANSRMANSRQSDKKLLLVLLTLCLVPMFSSGLRLFSISFQGSAEPENLNYLQNPALIVIHMITYVAFCVFRAFQIASGFANFRDMTDCQSPQQQLLLGV